MPLIVRAPHRTEANAEQLPRYDGMNQQLRKEGMNGKPAVWTIGIGTFNVDD